MPVDPFRAIDNKPIRWIDKTGLVHAVEGADVHPGTRLLWTLCRRDVPANKAWKLSTGDHHEMCVTCLAVLTRSKSGDA